MVDRALFSLVIKLALWSALSHIVGILCNCACSVQVQNCYTADRSLHLFFTDSDCGMESALLSRGARILTPKIAGEIGGPIE